MRDMSRIAPHAGLVWVALLVPLSHADGVEPPSPREVEERFAEGERLSGREIYDRFLHNRFRTLFQHATIVSTGPGGDPQEVEILARWKDFRDEQDRPRDGVISKTLVRFIEPFDVRRLTYLIIGHSDRPHDQFLYTPSTRRVRRVMVRGVGLMGTDYTIDDLAFQSIADGTYERLPDDQVGGLPAYVVRATMNEEFTTLYRVVTAYVDKEHYVLLRARYEDGAGLLLREMRANLETIQEFDGVWLATMATMRNVREKTSSTIVIHSLEPNPELTDRLFSTSRLENVHWD
jgi:hypothetical protein